MKNISYVCVLTFALFMSCDSETKNANSVVVTEESSSASNANSTIKINIEKIKETLCNNFPKELVLQYHPDASHIEIESIDNGSGDILHCNVKLFYGKKEYEFWQGQVYADINQQEDPFWQYNPERNATLYHKVEMGDKAVFISNMYQLQILKEGVLYSITPPNSGYTTSSGKSTKEIALEIAQHYKL